MTEFHEGQEVLVSVPSVHGEAWLRAKIVSEQPDGYEVEFDDGRREVTVAADVLPTN